MEKEKKLLLPYDACEIDAIEGWLDEQARDGWRLESVDGMHFYFTRPDDATLTRYRIDILPKKVPDLAERRATFDDLGWEYIATLFDNLDIYAATRPDAVEINTDEELLRQTVKSYYRRRNLKTYGILLLVLLAIYLLRYLLFGEFTPFYTYLLSSRGYIVWLVPLWALAFIIGLVLDSRIYKGVSNRMLLHREFHTPQRATVRKVVRYTVWIMLLVAVLLNGHSNLAAKDIEHPTFPHEDYPFPTLADISPQEDNGYKYALQEQTFPLSRYGWLSTSLTFAQQQAAGDIQWVYALDYHDTKWRWLAKGYANELLRQQDDAEAVTVEGYESAHYWQDSGEEHLLLWDGEKRVVEVTYSGEASLRDSLPVFAIP